MIAAATAPLAAAADRAQEGGRFAASRFQKKTTDLKQGGRKPAASLRMCERKGWFTPYGTVNADDAAISGG